ncbi:hypothetical protein Dsin_022176 [Dipteronia sinensis]|uniref:Cellulose synthase-like protein H1 n=1 Tax=Dipteronia sinensis TaxID=43782 RepID=A0AAE0DZP3_9ROSI|nr:hypothetical protein Dsin_022176 [Dipteronia sinensis]
MALSSMAANLYPLRLFEKVFPKNTTRRVLDVTLLLLLFSLVVYRLLSLQHHGYPWVLALLCESWFTIYWVIIVITRWTPLYYKTFPQLLQQRVQELPPVDMFVTTADPVLEPPIVTVNTVLSLMAVDYPANLLACYVSDDGCSPLTFHALVEASKFAKLWIPYCMKHNVQVRAPFKYFQLDESMLSSTETDDHSWEFQQEWKKMKEEYEGLSRNIEDAAKKSSFDLSGELAVFSNTECRNHPAIVKIINENKEGLSDGIPHLVYISREKQPKHPHHYKAGAMNALTRVSGLMTNAPFMLNVDCDMFVNDPQVVYQAMCLLLGAKEKDCAFVQFPQLYHDSSADCLVLLQEYICKGVVGIQGPFFQGTGCFHRRKVIYGLWPDDIENECARYFNSVNGKVDDEILMKEFGSSKEFIKSVVHALKGQMDIPMNPSNYLDAAHQVAGSAYEYGSSWGENVGCLYGSTAEDNLTGITIHKKGWRSGYCNPEPPGFLGCAPSDTIAAMIQQKRWSTGLLEILFSRNNPIYAALRANLQGRQCVAYLWLITWGLRSIPELSYAVLPAYCIITNTNFLPKFQEPGIYIPVAVLVMYSLYTLSEYIQSGFTVRSWWVNQSMARIVTMSAWLFGFLNAVLKLLGISEPTFEITPKEKFTSSDDGNNIDENKGKFTFDESPYFVVGTTILLVQLTALASGLLGLQQPPAGGQGSGLGEFFTSVIVVLCFWPFVEGLFRKGKYGIPLSTICKSAALTSLFVCLSKKSYMV